MWRGVTLNRTYWDDILGKRKGSKDNSHVNI